MGEIQLGHAQAHASRSLTCIFNLLGLIARGCGVHIHTHQAVSQTTTTHVRLRFKLAAGFGEAWTRDGGIPQGCPLSIVFIVALNLSWYKCLDDVRGSKPQQYAGNSKSVSNNSDALLDAARISNHHILTVGQTAAPTKCVLLGASAEIRRMMKSWVISGEDQHWKVEMDIGDFGGQIDTTLRRRAGTVSGRIRKEFVQLAAVGALLSGFKEKLQILRTKSGPSALHGSEASPI